ncbi:MAG: hypothetical protein EOO83_04005 [Oxalobacteraceae bacterium]|nr:MAG: hypothetical protein EOO83_04005 [Oxalobacteraceae bacterium]
MIWRSLSRLSRRSRSTTVNQLPLPASRSALIRIEVPPWVTARDRLWMFSEGLSWPVYSFTDQTGQLKPSENIQSLSRAVTQGGTSILIKALRDTGQVDQVTLARGDLGQLRCFAGRGDQRLLRGGTATERERRARHQRENCGLLHNGTPQSPFTGRSGR